MFSQTAEYALRAAVTLARQPDTALNAAELARQTEVPGTYLFKVMAQLARAGLVSALRGKRGGYRLGRPPAQISILDVINAVDPLPRLRACPLGRPEHLHRLCPLHQQLDDTYAQIEATLRARPLADLVENPLTTPVPVSLCAPLASPS
ncbi:Rrf2 family transcriptional regulator [Deinococcus multiflagellatus]|uniref:Rrf2 family transcriptional regulator n=1 Tax=Deinococcus multiflagellatus TaxID=1656887 RepID=A0ABW1ZR85_9DEIO|nr:RrF2 family transcriptional regulator [Deinococcus multiflagellatus]MBZ9713571.1 RrF2 family transcriptional regulator [Deinococcus multiflagellatus]